MSAEGKGEGQEFFHRLQGLRTDDPVSPSTLLSSQIAPKGPNGAWFHAMRYNACCCAPADTVPPPPPRYTRTNTTTQAVMQQYAACARPPGPVKGEAGAWWSYVIR